jgi:hypothetical protein
MAELKSAYELAMERLRARGDDEKSLSPEQRDSIAEIRREYKAKLAEREIMKASRLGRLAERTRPEELEARRLEIEQEHADERRRLDEEMEAKIRDVREGQG